MDRKYLDNDFAINNLHELHTQTAFHEAGHAAAIHFHNADKQLPPVYFDIKIQKADNERLMAQVIDGYLVQHLAYNSDHKPLGLDAKDEKDYRCAFEADIVNLLVGPLSEARYVAFRDNETFNSDLINIHALQHYYGGASDIRRANQYLSWLIEDEQKQQQKLTELLNQAFKFVNNQRHWQAIRRLAEYILDNQETIISCEQAIAVFEKHNQQDNIMH